MSGKLQGNEVHIFSFIIHGRLSGCRTVKTAVAFDSSEKAGDISSVTKSVERRSASRVEEDVCTLHRKDGNCFLKWGSLRKYDIRSRGGFIEGEDCPHLISRKEQKENYKLSGTNLKKLGRKASDESCFNVLNADEHNEPLLNIDMLFENAVMKKTVHDGNKCCDIRGIERFERTFIYEGAMLLFVSTGNLSADMLCVIFEEVVLFNLLIALKAF